MDDYKIVFSQNDPMCPLESGRKVFDEIEKPVPPWLDMSAVLDVIWRPELFSDGVTTFVKKSVESVQYQGLIVFGSGFHTKREPMFMLMRRDLYRENSFLVLWHSTMLQTNSKRLLSFRRDGRTRPDAEQCKGRL